MMPAGDPGAQGAPERPPVTPWNGSAAGMESGSGNWKMELIAPGGAAWLIRQNSGKCGDASRSGNATPPGGGGRSVVAK